jgi:hypothetical protein
MSIAHARTFSAAFVGAVLISSCAPACLPAAEPAPDAVAPTTVPAPTTTIQQQGQLTVTYDGAGPNAPRLGLIGDSTLASIRWTGSWSRLRQWNYTYDAEACRRAATPSCHGADGYAPENVLEVMHRLRGRLGSLLVVMGGANDPVNVFGAGIRAVVDAARAQGIGGVVWLTIRNAPDKNAILTQQVAKYGGYLMIADWDTYSAPHPEWTIADGLHLSAAGAPELAGFIAGSVTPLVG